MISCVIIDDEQHAIDLLSNHVSKIPLLDLKFATTDPLSGFQFVSGNKPDLVFLDIHMPDLNGMQFLKLLKGRSKVILTTAYSEYALEGYEHDIADYLLKPIVFERFLKAVQKAVDLLKEEPVKFTSPAGNIAGDDEFIFVKAEGRTRFVKIQLRDIEFIEAAGNYLTIHASTSKIITLLTIKELEKQLPEEQFIRIHNSYLVPISRITEIEGNQVVIGNQKLPIGDVYKKNFLSKIEKHIIKSKK